MSSVFLKVIEIEKELDVSRETLSILGDFNIAKLYEILASGEGENTKEKILTSFEKLEFFDEHPRDGFDFILDLIGQDGDVTLDQFKTIFYPRDEIYVQ